LFEFADETAADRYVVGGRPSVRQGLLVVAFDRQTPEEQAAYAEVLANLST